MGIVSQGKNSEGIATILSFAFVPCCAAILQKDNNPFAKFAWAYDNSIATSAAPEVVSSTQFQRTRAKVSDEV
jgi:hypothetical protein